MGKLLAGIKQTLESQKLFVSKIAHELNNSMSVMQLDTESALEATDSNYQLGLSKLKSQELIDALKTDLDGLKSMANIIHNLSTMTSYQYNPGHLAMTRVNLSLLLVRLCKAISTQFTDKKAIDIDIDIDIDKPVYISGNHVALEQMVMNLLSNAVKYTPAGGNVTASISKTPAEVIMSIKDTGIGMSDKDILRIFKPFYRSADKMAQEEKGSGLGLTIVNDIAKEHKAKIFVKSALKKGTEISVSFPATQ